MKRSPPIKRRIPAWPFVIFATLSIIGAGIYYFYDNYVAQNRWKPYLQQELKELVLKTSDSLYHIEYSDFDLDIASGNATLSNFKLIPDTIIYDKLIRLKKAPDNLFILRVKKLSIKNIGALKAYKQKILDIDNISIEKPDLTIINKRFAYNDTADVGKPKNPYQLIENTFKQLHINAISLNAISLNYINNNGPTEKQIAFKNLNIHISDVLIDSLSGMDTNRFYYTKDIEVTIKDYKIATPDSLYTASVKQIYFSTARRSVNLDDVTFLPKYNHTDFYLKTNEAGDIYNLKFKHININDIALQQFLRDQKLYAETLDIDGARIKIYNNNAYKGVKSIKIGKDPQQALQKVALDMRLKRLNIKNTMISYSETDATSGYTGVITFNRTNGYISNVTNDADAKKADPFMIAHLETRFMNTADLNVNFRFNLMAKNGAFNYQGTLGNFDGRVLDKLVKPLALVHVRSADIDHLNFDVDASNYSAKGHLEFYYNNLNIQLLKKVPGKPGLQKQGFISKLANTLIIEDANPDKKGNFRPGPIDLQRDPRTSFFSFLYKALLDGLKPSVGFDKKTEVKVDNAISTVNSLAERLKKFEEVRRQKREERQKIREAKKNIKEQNDKN